MTDNIELAHLTRERDLYWRLLEIGAREDLKPLVEEALSLIVNVTGAKKGFLALYQGEQETPFFSLAKSCSDEEVKDIQQKISRGIIAQAMATGETINTGSALEDPRFQENVSVMAHSIQAVLCAPIGVETPLGVIYLQERDGPEGFSEE